MLQSRGTLNYGELFVITFSVFTQWNYMYCVKCWVVTYKTSLNLLRIVNGIH